MKALRKVLCALDLHRWGQVQDNLACILDNDNCERLLYEDRSWAESWPNYPYQRCEICQARRDLPKTYGETRRDLPKARAQVRRAP